MFIRKYWRELCVTLTAFFWSSCGEDNNSVAPSDNSQLPSENQNASSGTVPTESSSSLEQVVAEMSSSSAEPVRDTSVITLSSDPSVTCEKTTSFQMYPIYAVARRAPGTCEEYQILVEKDSAYTSEELNDLEDGLENCRRYICEPVCVYGVISTPMQTGTRSETTVTYKCSNGTSYSSRFDSPKEQDFPKDVAGVLYLTKAEYASAMAAKQAKPAPKFAPEQESSSSIEENVESSSSSEASPVVVKRTDFVEVNDVVDEARKALYVKYVEELKNSETSEERKSFLKTLLDEEEQAIRKDMLPEYDMFYDESYKAQCSSKGWLEDSIWFSGYIAKHQQLSDGSVEETERYKEKFNAILERMERQVESKYKPSGNPVIDDEPIA